MNTISGIGRDENQHVTCERERESANVNERWGAIQDKDLLFGTDGDGILYLRAGLHAAPHEAVGHLNNLSNTV